MSNIAKYVHIIYRKIGNKKGLKDLSTSQTVCEIVANVFSLYAIVYTFFMILLKDYLLIFLGIVFLMLINFSRKLIIKRKVFEFALISYFSALLFVFILVIMFPAKCHFDLFYIDMLIMAFLGSLISVKTETGRFKSKYGIISVCILFIVSYIISSIHGPFRLLPNFMIEIFNILCHVFTFATVSLGLIVEEGYITEKENDYLDKIAFDPLTNLKNRYFVYDKFSFLKKNGHLKDYQLGYIDVDNLSAINSKYGYLCGDQILKEIGQIILEQNLSIEPIRFNGDKFIILDYKPLSQGCRTVTTFEKLRKVIEDNVFIYENKEIKVTVSIGVASYGEQSSVEDWIHKAEGNARKAKDNGKNLIVLQS